MRWRVVFSFLILIFVLSAPATLNLAGVEPPAETAGLASDADDEREVFELVNRERARMRLGPLEWDDHLARLARSYSRKMARERFFEHIDPDGNSVMDRARDSRIGGWRKIGENLFYSEPIDRVSGFAVRGWMRSPSHRRNILDRTWTATGVGLARTRNGSVYITQVFTDD